jgi:cytochrome b561
MDQQQRRPGMQRSPVQPSNVVSTLLHWLLVLLALTLLGLGWWAHYWPDAVHSFPRVLWIHMSLGITTAMIALFTLFWRLVSVTLPGWAAVPSLLGRLRLVAAAVLYLLLVFQPVTGYFALLFDNKAVDFWTLSFPPPAYEDLDLSAMYGRWHQVWAIVLAITVGLDLLLALVAAMWGKHLAPAGIEPALPQTVALQEASRREEPWSGPTPESRRMAGYLRLSGWIAFWGQLALGGVSVLLLMTTASSAYYEANPVKMLGFGTRWLEGGSWADFAIVVLGLTTVGFFVCTRIGKRFYRGLDPRGWQLRLRRIISAITFGSSLGVSMGIIGAAFSIALLIAKTVAQPPGIAITDPAKIVRAVDIFVLLENFNIVVAHFIGILSCLWMLNRVNHYYSWLGKSAV